jgi:hypothetical protein
VEASPLGNGSDPRGSPSRGVGYALKIGRVVRELLGNGGVAGRIGTSEAVGWVNVSAVQGGFRGRGRTRPTELRNATDQKVFHTGKAARQRGHEGVHGGRTNSAPLADVLYEGVGDHIVGPTSGIE